MELEVYPWITVISMSELTYMEEAEVDALNRIKDLIGEHFTNFAFVVVTEDGELFCDYRDRYVGKALFREAIEDMDSDPFAVMSDIDWGDEDDEEEWEEDE